MKLLKLLWLVVAISPIAGNAQNIALGFRNNDFGTVFFKHNQSLNSGQNQQQFSNNQFFFDVSVLLESKKRGQWIFRSGMGFISGSNHRFGSNLLNPDFLSEFKIKANQRAYKLTIGKQFGIGSWNRISPVYGLEVQTGFYEPEVEFVENSTFSSNGEYLGGETKESKEPLSLSLEPRLLFGLYYDFLERWSLSLDLNFGCEIVYQNGKTGVTTSLIDRNGVYYGTFFSQNDHKRLRLSQDLSFSLGVFYKFGPKTVKLDEH